MLFHYSILNQDLETSEIEYVSPLENKYFTAFKANFITGFSTLYYITKDFNINGSVLYNLIINNHYENDSNETHNIYLSLGIEYNI